jgi:hypothetical protein
VQSINLTTAVAAFLEFGARWEIEKNWDYVEIQAGINGANYTPLCALYTHDGNSNQDPGPLYDGFQRSWIKERIDLAGYLGQNIKLRFTLVSDGGVEYDGFYYDDITVKIVDTSATSLGQQEGTMNFQVIPNPNSGTCVLMFSEDPGASCQVTILDILGRKIYEVKAERGSRSIALDSHLPPGTYFISTTLQGRTIHRKMVVER